MVLFQLNFSFDEKDDKNSPDWKMKDERLCEYQSGSCSSRWIVHNMFLEVKAGCCGGMRLPYSPASCFATVCSKLVDYIQGQVGRWNLDIASTDRRPRNVYWQSKSRRDVETQKIKQPRDKNKRQMKVALGAGNLVSSCYFFSAVGQLAPFGLILCRNMEAQSIVLMFPTMEFFSHYMVRCGQRKRPMLNHFIFHFLTLWTFL